MNVTICGWLSLTAQRHFRPRKKGLSKRRKLLHDVQISLSNTVFSRLCFWNHWFYAARRLAEGIIFIKFSDDGRRGSVGYNLSALTKPGSGATAVSEDAFEQHSRGTSAGPDADAQSVAKNRRSRRCAPIAQMELNAAFKQI